MIAPLIMAVGWIIAYVLIIRRAYLDKTHGMPLPALSFNIAWEGMILVLLPRDSPTWYVVLIWFLLDCVILAQYFVYARPKSYLTLRDRLFWPGSLAMLVVGIGTTVAVTISLQDYGGGITGYAMNAFMSMLFCWMLLARDSLKGQSFYIALFKFIGTGATFTYADRSDPLYAWFGLMFIGFDLAYIALVWIVGRRDGIKVLRRV